MTIKDEKDRYGDKLRDAERAHEDSYFAQREKQLLQKMRGGDAAEEAVRQEALGRCPRCGVRLSNQQIQGVSVDACTKCHGVWLDKGELDTVAKGENAGWIARWLRTDLNR